MEDKIKHLEFVQNIMSRLSKNSFQLKGWMTTIVSALLALFVNSSNVLYIFIAIIPTLVFWFLDTYYLQQERKFRGLYDDIIAGEIPNFEMSIENYKYDQKDTKTKKYCYCKVLFSKTLWPLYGLLAFSLLFVGIILSVNSFKII